MLHDFCQNFTHNSQSVLDCTSQHQLGTVGRHSEWMQESVQSNGKIVRGKQNSPGIQTCKRTIFDFKRSWVGWTGYWHNYRHVSPTAKVNGAVRHRKCCQKMNTARSGGNVLKVTYWELFAEFQLVLPNPLLIWQGVKCALTGISVIWKSAVHCVASFNCCKMRLQPQAPIRHTGGRCFCLFVCLFSIFQWIKPLSQWMTQLPLAREDVLFNCQLCRPLWPNYTLLMVYWIDTSIFNPVILFVFKLVCEYLRPLHDQCEQVGL